MPNRTPPISKPTRQRNCAPDIAGVPLGTIRKKCWRSLTPAVAWDAGITLSEVEQFMALRHTPEREKLQLLAKRLGLL